MLLEQQRTPGLADLKTPGSGRQLSSEVFWLLPFSYLGWLFTHKTGPINILRGSRLLPITLPCDLERRKAVWDGSKAMALGQGWLLMASPAGPSNSFHFPRTVSHTLPCVALLCWSFCSNYFFLNIFRKLLRSSAFTFISKEYLFRDLSGCADDIW